MGWDMHRRLEHAMGFLSMSCNAPGMVKTPVAFTSFAATATKLLMTSEQAFCFKPCSVARAFAKAPFVIALAPAFIVFDFMGGNILLVRKKELDRKGDLICC